MRGITPAMRIPQREVVTGLSTCWVVFMAIIVRSIISGFELSLLYVSALKSGHILVFAGGIKTLPLMHAYHRDCQQRQGW